MLKKIILVVASCILLPSCAGYDKWAEETNKKISDGYTSLIMGGKIKTEIDKSVPSAFKINLAYRMGEGVGLPSGGTSPFINKLNGDVTYNKSCRYLSFNVSLYNHDNALIKTEPVMVMGYTANEKAIIDHDILADGSRKASFAVARMVVKNVKCN